MSTLPDAIRYEVEGYARLRAARGVMEAILQGRWAPTPPVVAALAKLVDRARQDFAWAEMAAA